MFDIGFVELLICGIIALLVLGPERLPGAARAAGRWVGGARRMVNQFTSELDRELRADELRKELKKAGDIGLEDVEKSVRGALDEAKQYENMILSDTKGRKPGSASPKSNPEAIGTDSDASSTATGPHSDTPSSGDGAGDRKDDSKPESRS